MRAERLKGVQGPGLGFRVFRTSGSVGSIVYRGSPNKVYGVGFRFAFVHSMARV